MWCLKSCKIQNTVRKVTRARACRHACVHVHTSTFYVQVSMKNVNPWGSCHFAIEVQGRVSNSSKFLPLGSKYMLTVPFNKGTEMDHAVCIKHEWVLFILRSIQALWKLALEHGSKWKRHHGPNEKLNTIYSSPLVRVLSLLSFEWFWNAFSSWAQSLQGWHASLTFFPCLAGNESPCSFCLSTPHPNLRFNLMGSPDSFLFMCPSLPFFTAVFSFCWDDFYGLQTTKADWWIYPICWMVCFRENQTLENCLGREVSLKVWSWCC